MAHLVETEMDENERITLDVRIGSLGVPSMECWMQGQTAEGKT